MGSSAEERDAILQVGPGDLLELKFISRLQKSIPLEKIVSLEGRLYGIELHCLHPAPSPNLQFPKLELASLPKSSAIDLVRERKGWQIYLETKTFKFKED